MSPPLARKDGSGFTLAEVLIAVSVVALFGLASFATNERLLVGLKSQQQATAATMMLQERMEAFRSLAYSGIDGSGNAVGLVSSVSSGNTPPTNAADVIANATTSEAQLGGISGSLTETITISGYMDGSGNVPPTTAGSNTWVRNSSHTSGSLTASGSLVTCASGTCTPSYDLLKVDIQISWTGANGITHNREATAIIGKGNKGSS